MHAFWSVLNYDLLENRRIDNVTSNNNFASITSYKNILCCQGSVEWNIKGDVKLW